MATRPNPPAIPGPPDFGKNVIIFDRKDSSDILSQKISLLRGISQVQTEDGSEFNQDRYAVLFKKGTYDLNGSNVDVGYYMTVHGLGQMPDDVMIKGQVRSPGSKNPETPGMALNNFWRGVENLAILPPPGNDGTRLNIWAVSQATFMRRVHLTGNGKLWLWDLNTKTWAAGYSSGGFIADSSLDCLVDSGSQQQFLFRNVALNGGFNGGVWNMVFIGNENPPAGSWAGRLDAPVKPYAKVEKTPVIREKPYLICNDDGSYFVQVPPLHREETSGVSWARDSGKCKAIPISSCFIARAGAFDCTASIMNAKLAQGYHLIFTPGIYHLDRTLEVNHPSTVILGLGMATLIPDSGIPAMIVADVDGVSISGLVFDAGPQQSPSLLTIGHNATHGLPKADHKNNPTAIFDCCARVGNGGPAAAVNCFTVNSNDVILDNVWLWRADHGRMGTHDPSIVSWHANPAENGLSVNGNGVIAYGLFVEHFRGYQTFWNGNDGQVYFYQSEIPYDVPDQTTWRQQPMQKGFASYKLSDNVTSHTAHGLGVYSNFWYHNVQLDNAIEVPDISNRPEIKIQNMCTVWLDGVDGSGINHVVNGKQADGWEIKDKGSAVLTRAQQAKPSRVLNLVVSKVNQKVP